MWRAGRRGRSAALSAHHPDSGIRGRVTIGPTCPVQRVAHACVRPYRLTIAIRRQPTNRLAATVRTSANGRFTVALAPGRYLLVPQSGRPYPRSSPQAATVSPNRYTSVVISYDTGIPLSPAGAPDCRSAPAGMATNVR